MTTPIDPTHHEAMNLIARNLDDQLNPLRHMTGKRVTGFMLTVFDLGQQGRFNYISNADKIDVRQMLQDVLARLDSRVGENTEEMKVVQRNDLDRALAALQWFRDTVPVSIPDDKLKVLDASIKRLAERS